MLRAAAAIAAILAAASASYASEECGGPGVPCGIAGGLYHVVAPAGAGPHPAVIFLHGYGGRADRTVENAALMAAFLDRGYAVIAPQGTPRRDGDRGGSWNAFGDPARRDDVAFVRAAVEDAAARFGLDRDRVLAAGFSGGGMMAWRIACDAPGDYAAYAPIAGLLWRPLPETCAGPARLLHVHGWADEVVPVEGREIGGGRIVQGDLFAGLALLRAAFGCPDAPDATAAEDGWWRRSWTACAPGAELALALHPGGHAIPTDWPSLALDWFEAAPGD